MTSSNGRITLLPTQSTQGCCCEGLNPSPSPPAQGPHPKPLPQGGGAPCSSLLDPTPQGSSLTAAPAACLGPGTALWLSVRACPGPAHSRHAIGTCELPSDRMRAGGLVGSFCHAQGSAGQNQVPSCSQGQPQMADTSFMSLTRAPGPQPSETAGAGSWRGMGRLASFTSIQMPSGTQPEGHMGN